MTFENDWLSRLGLKNRTYRLMAVGAFGVLLLIISTLSPKSEPMQGAVIPPPGESVTPEADYYQVLTSRLEEVLSHIAGAGEVRVLLRLTAQPEQVIAFDQTSTTRQVEERDVNGTTRQTLETSQDQRPVLSRSSTGGEVPVITTVKKPHVEGVLVVCTGARSSQVRNDVTRAVATALAIPVYRIRVVPMQ